MLLYLDTSAVMKRYVDELDTPLALDLMEGATQLITSRLTEIEVRRNLARLLTDEPLDIARRHFAADLQALLILSVDDVVCSDAAVIAEATMCRSLDALHLAAARRVGPGTSLLTFDRRQAAAAREVGIEVLGS